MRYKDKSFTVPLGGEKFADNWERTFRDKVEAIDPKPTPNADPAPSMKQFVHNFACRECASTVRVITSAVIAAKGAFFIRVDIGTPNNVLACPICRNAFTYEEKQP